MNSAYHYAYSNSIESFQIIIKIKLISLRESFFKWKDEYENTLHVFSSFYSGKDRGRGVVRRLICVFVHGVYKFQSIWKYRMVPSFSHEV